MAFRKFRQILEGEPWGRDVLLKLNQLFRGKFNIVGTVTLTAGAASTVLTDDLITPDSFVKLGAETANAAAALSTTYLPRADYALGQVTIRHANNAQVDRTFTYEVTG